MKKEDKKKVVKTVAAGVTTASLLVGGTFESVDDITNTYRMPKAQAQHYNDHSDDIFEDLRKKTGPKNRFKEAVYKIPIRIRTGVFVPLWLLGSLFLSLIRFVARIIIVPLLHLAGNFLVHVLVMFAVIGICVKLLFPDLPLKKIFNRRTLLLAISASLVMSIADLILPAYIENYRLYKFIFKFLFGLLVLIIILKPFIKKKFENFYTYELIYDDKTLEL